MGQLSCSSGIWPHPFPHAMGRAGALFAIEEWKCHEFNMRDMSEHIHRAYWARGGIRLRRVTTVSGSHEPIAGSRHRNRMVFSNTALDRLVKVGHRHAWRRGNFLPAASKLFLLLCLRLEHLRQLCSEDIIDEPGKANDTCLAMDLNQSRSSFCLRDTHRVRERQCHTIS
jgi:hypothetical protein